MRIALTGALGNVGTYVRRFLAERGNDVTALDVREPTEDDSGRQVDLTDYLETVDALRGHDAVVHLAGINAPIVAPEWHVHNNNVTASYNVLAAAAELGIPRVVQSSSVNAIGLSWSQHPEFESFPIGLDHPSRTDDGYSLSKLIQELQADSITRRFNGLTVVTLRLHAVLEHARVADDYVAHLGESWAVNGLWGYCTFESVAEAIEQALVVPIDRTEVLWIVEAETFSREDSRVLASRHYPDVPIHGAFEGRAGFFDMRRTREVLGPISGTESAHG